VIDRSKKDQIIATIVHGFNSSPGIWDAFSGLMAGDEKLAGVVTEAGPPFGYATGLYRRRIARAIPSVNTIADSSKEYLRTEAAPERFERLSRAGALCISGSAASRRT